MFGGQQSTGDPNPTVPIDARSLLYSNARLVSTAASASGSVTNHVRQMVALRQRGWWDPAELITHRLPFHDLAAAYDMYENRADGIVKAVMSMGNRLTIPLEVDIEPERYLPEPLSPNALYHRRRRNA